MSREKVSALIGFQTTFRRSLCQRFSWSEAPAQEVLLPACWRAVRRVCVAAEGGLGVVGSAGEGG